MQVLHSGGLEYLQQAPETGPIRQIVVLLHGYGRNATLMQKLADEVAGRLPQALILMPQAPEEYEAPASDHGNALRVPEQLRTEDREGNAPGQRRQWFSIQAATIEDMDKQLRRAVTQINDFISRQLAEYGLKDSDVALMGFSQGGVVALYAAYRRMAPIACVVGHSTIFMGGNDLHSKPPTLYLYGLDDEEFTARRYEESGRHIKLHVNDVVMKALEKLRHTTNAESRAIVADYIAARFG